MKKVVPWDFILYQRLPEKSEFSHGNSFFMSHVIFIGRACHGLWMPREEIAFTRGYREALDGRLGGQIVSI